jgi:hypothetical protein
MICNKDTPRLSEREGAVKEQFGAFSSALGE